MTVNIRVNLEGLNSLMDKLATDVEDAARPAAQAAANVFYLQVKANVAALGKKTGNLERSIYHAFSKNNSGKGYAVYHVSWNYKKAPHGHLVEFGHIQRYRVYLNKAGEWKTMIRPGMAGKKPPSRKAPQAVKDAYYVPLDTPRQVAAQPFIRNALSKAAEASAAAETALLKAIGAL